MDEPIAESTSYEVPDGFATDKVDHPQLPKKELTSAEICRLARAARDAIHLTAAAEEITEENFEKTIEDAILVGSADIAQELAEQLGTVDPSAYEVKSRELLAQLATSGSTQETAELQIQLIYQIIAVTAQLQNGGDKGFTPAVAREVPGLDCSLSAWILKQRLQQLAVSDMTFKFGYCVGHAVGVVELADGRNVYVDAQNGFVQEVQLAEVVDSEQPQTGYPIYEITDSERHIGHLPDGTDTTRARPDGSDYVPKYLGVQEDGLLHTLGNMHMLVNPTSATFHTEAGRRFRQGIGMLEDERAQWEAHYAGFNQLVDRIAGGPTIYDTMFAELETENHEGWQETQRKAAEQKEVERIKESLMNKSDSAETAAYNPSNKNALTNHEMVSTTNVDLNIQRQLWDDLVARTRAESTAGREFLVFLLARGNDTAVKAVSVGVGHKSGVMWDFKQAIDALSEDIAAGYHIVGDLHNHPDVATYLAAGLPAHYTACPSISDLATGEMQKVEKYFDQAPWPRTILCHDSESGSVHANTYVQNRDLSVEEENRAQFEDPLFVEEKPDGSRIVFHAPLFLNPELLVREDVISLGDILVHSDEEVITLRNLLQSILEV